ncbi:uncharacterized protein BXIN_0341 [Babesia sp. Xinjiang]|uniref:uncharacterized protein n=1 Tax=Babesia sp. Xinjiang TaxID=462227 RepID=UPI000A2494C7|nr:uncharacterized protein BXIN_0341 [Babesia sp. Xinjiang]ORM41213.1 hypothetical protein BXIN_0341 [Babesia sp. Xinjiang]
MSLLHRQLVELCPVNVLRPSIPCAVDALSRVALIDVYNDALSLDPVGYRNAFRAIYSLDSADLPSTLDFDSASDLDTAKLSTGELSLGSLLAFNATGCVCRTSSILYRALQDSLHGVDGDWQSTCTGLLFYVLLSVGVILIVVIFLSYLL